MARVQECSAHTSEAWMSSNKYCACAYSICCWPYLYPNSFREHKEAFKFSKCRWNFLSRLKRSSSQHEVLEAVVITIIAIITIIIIIPNIFSRSYTRWCRVGFERYGERRLARRKSPILTAQTTPRPFQPGQNVSPAYRKCECFVILTEAIWIKVRSAANRVGTCAMFVTAHPRLKRMRTTFLKPSPMSGKFNWGGKFYSCTKVLKEKVFIRPLQGQSMISMRSRWSDVFQF